MTLTPGIRAQLDEFLGPLGKITTKRVFGLDGIKLDGVLLGFVIDERIYFRTDAESIAGYKNGGGKPYTFTKRGGEFIVTSYWSLPERLYDEPDELAKWAKHAYAAALQSPSARIRQAKRARRALKPLAKPKARRRDRSKDQGSLASQRVKKFE